MYLTLYMEEQLPHGYLLKLIHQTERFVGWLESLSTKSVMDFFFYYRFYGCSDYS